MEVSLDLKKFFEQQNTQNMVVQNNWEDIYAIWGINHPNIVLSDFLLECKINPFEYMKAMPNQAFEECFWLKTFDIPKGIVTVGEYCFCNCTNLTHITIPNTVVSLQKSVFSECSRLQDFTIPDSVQNIGNLCFYSCNGLNHMILPDSVTTLEHGAFFCCTNLVDIKIGKGLSQLTANCFHYCENLTKIIIPDTITYMGEFLFHNCSKLTNIEYQGTIEQWKNIDKQPNWLDKSISIEVDCTDGSTIELR